MATIFLNIFHWFFVLEM